MNAIAVFAPVLVMGTGTFNTHYNEDVALVSKKDYARTNLTKHREETTGGIGGTTFTLVGKLAVGQTYRNGT